MDRVQPSQGCSFLLIFHSPEIPGNHLIDLERMIG